MTKLTGLILCLGSAFCFAQETETVRYWTVEDKQELISELNNTRTLLLERVHNLNDKQWNFKPDSGTWSIAEIIEHVGLQEDMHMREVLVISQTPPQFERAELMQDHREEIMSYEFDPNPGTAGWMVEPVDRWCDKETALKACIRHYDKLEGYLENTETDLRVHFTYRKNLDASDFRSVRDLHQILLTTFAHTRRHIHQIERIKAHPRFPGDD